MAPLDKVWPAPAPLEGVKSRKKAIFKVVEASLNVDDQASWYVSAASLSLESRVAAVGDAGEAMLALLKRDLRQESGTVSHHEKLVVAHLGPHLAGSTAGAEDHAAAVAGALQQRPQIVILEEGLACGGVGWSRAFRTLLRGPELPAFKGAVVVACREETFAVRQACSEAWFDQGSKVVEQVAIGQRLQIVEDALARVGDLDSPSSAKARKQQQTQGLSAPEVGVLLQEAGELSDFCFEEDLVTLARKEGWTVALLTEAHQGEHNLRGYLCYKMVAHANTNALHIERLAVDKRCRGRGFAAILMRWILGEAARRAHCDCSVISCDSVEKAIPFYEKFGFTVLEGLKPQSSDGEDALTPMASQNVSLVSEAL